MDTTAKFAFLQGLGKELYTPAVSVLPTDATTSLLAPPNARGRVGMPLPLGTRRTLASVPFGAATGATLSPIQRLGGMLHSAFGVLRREPHNIYNDHRAVPSVRSKFPIHAFLLQAGRAWYVDPLRHALVALEGAGSACRAPVRLVLAGRFTDLPNSYQRLRSALLLLEIGINLRMAFCAAEVFGFRPALAGIGDERLARLLGVPAEAGWTPPVVIDLGPEEFTLRDVTLPGTRHGAPEPEGVERDAILAEVIRSQDALRALGDDLRDEPGSALPAETGSSGKSWSEVLWTRSSGRGPDGVDGFSGRRLRRPKAVLDELRSWAAIAQPSGLLREIGAYLRVSVCVQDIDGMPTGVYRVTDDLALARADETVMTRISDQFGYPPSPGMDSGMAAATMAWVVHADLPALRADFGPAGWALAQLWTGWMTQGLCLAAAAHGMYARPARSYDEVTMQTILDLPPAEIPLLMVIVGTARYREPALGLWT